MQTAKAIARDVSKYLFFFCNEEEVEWSSFLSKDNLLRFVALALALAQLLTEYKRTMSMLRTDSAT